MLESFYNNLIAEDRYRMILDGLQVTLLITLGAVILGTILGGIICWMRMSRHTGLQKVAKVYIDIMRGTPVLVVLMLMYYVIMAPLEATGIVVAIVTFGMNAAAWGSCSYSVTCAVKPLPNRRPPSSERRNRPMLLSSGFHT